MLVYAGRTLTLCPQAKRALVSQADPSESGSTSTAQSDVDANEPWIEQELVCCDCFSMQKVNDDSKLGF